MDYQSPKDIELCLSSNASLCCQISLQGAEEKFLYIYFFPILFALSVFGNIMNVVLYKHSFLNSSSTVRLLLYRAVANLLFSVSLLPTCAYSMENAARRPQEPYVVHVYNHLEIFYWSTLKFVMFASNVLNTISVWLTVSVTFQMMGLIVWPLVAKHWLSMRTARWVAAVVVVFALLLHAILITHRSVKRTLCPDDHSVVAHHYLSLSAHLLNQYYYYVQAVLINIAPLLILVVCCMTIAWKGLKMRNGVLAASRKTGRSDCVLHLAAATTVCHLVFEFPSAIVQVLASFSSLLDSQFLMLIAVTNFLTICNASLPFVIYTLCITRYRQLALFMCGVRRGQWRVPIEEPSGEKRSDFHHSMVTASLMNHDNSAAH